MNPGDFFAELKRRNVYKVAVAYAVVAWLLLQLASILFPAFEAPAWVMKGFIALVAAGFPIALILAWAFELTAQGIKRAADAGAGKSPSRGWIVLVVIATVGAAAVGFWQWQSRPGDKRIAPSSAAQPPARRSQRRRPAPRGLGAPSAAAAADWDAQKVIAEKNQGGDMIESVLRGVGSACRSGWPARPAARPPAPSRWRFASRPSGRGWPGAFRRWRTSSARSLMRAIRARSRRTAPTP